MGEARRPTQPPPPTHMTVSRNGASLVQKWKPTVIASPRNGTRASAPSEMFSRLNTPTATFGSARSKPAVDALGRDVDVGRVGEAVERDELAQPVDERQRPEEADAAEHDVDLGLAGRPGVEADPAEHQLHQPGVAVADEVEVEVDDLGEDVDRRRRARRRPDLDVERAERESGLAA